MNCNGVTQYKFGRLAVLDLAKFGVSYEESLRCLYAVCTVLLHSAVLELSYGQLLRDWYC